ncbi:hypothetical protein Bca52824_086843 [Brassica carinata]|uniref:Glycosyltransferase n=1 Tax=Brassica carinata TaxID=52824 RepID=A0A8X7TM78_BRACI|nr:hypothetical protein Bca52824_086843 [Brassica carinata]
MAPPHFLLVTLPAQGHVNPSLRFAHRLIRTTGARVTLATCHSVFHCSNIQSHDNVYNLSLLTFSDGFDDGVISNTEDVQNRLLNLERNGDKTLSEFIEANKNGDSPVACVIYTILPSWVPRLARRFHLPSVLLWIQPALAFNVYYNHSTGNNFGFEFPNLPTLETRDLPSFLSPSNTSNNIAQEVHLELMEFLKEEPNVKVLVNTFDSLEAEALTAVRDIEMVAAGPLLPPDMFTRSEPVKDQSNYTLWLDSKTESSVIYVSFGTMVELSKKQIKELARALIECKRPFLWVITDKANREAKIKGENETEIEKIASLRHELDEVGMIVSWCSQVEVLRHRAVGCYLSHCGWNSTLESLVLGVPVVAFPMWSDQPTNAKLVLLEDLWRTGVRVRENEDGLVERGEIRRCLEAVMEEKSVELRENGEAWKRLAVEAGRERGSSDKNMEAFVETLFSGAEEVKDKNQCLEKSTLLS